MEWNKHLWTQKDHPILSEKDIGQSISMYDNNSTVGSVGDS